MLLLGEKKLQKNVNWAKFLVANINLEKTDLSWLFSLERIIENRFA